ncbi:MAG: DUF4251 domain-containing protein [Bacteroidales bacterium]|nr:DUF4251 domain-containing protein [Bacteroidales bacterium]
MKIGTIVLITVTMALAGCGASSSSTDSGQKNSKQEKKAAEFEKTAVLIEGGRYQFTVRSATPTGGKTIQITSEYTMEVSEGVYEAYLPYFGRAYQASYGGDGGIEFKGEPENLQVTRNDKKNTISVSFDIKSDNDQYTISLVIGSSGYGTLMIASQKRQNISYYGQAGELKI